MHSALGTAGKYKGRTTDMAKLLLNAVPVTVRADAQVVTGVVPYAKESLDALREKHRGEKGVALEKVLEKYGL